MKSKPRPRSKKAKVAQAKDSNVINSTKVKVVVRDFVKKHKAVLLAASRGE